MSTLDCGRFYKGRDPRTHEYLGQVPLQADREIVVATGPRTARTEAGQFLLLTLANLLPRVHRRIAFVLPESAQVDLEVPCLFGSAETLGQALVQTAEILDPCGECRLLQRVPSGETIGVGVGRDAPHCMPWYVGARGALAELRSDPVALDDEFGRGTLRGAGLAACLGASVPFQMIHGVCFTPRRLSAWNCREGEAAEIGPSSLEPIDPGRVLMVGAGAVGSCLVYWLRAWGANGDWTVADGDTVALHNTNRSLLFTPEHAGWPDGEPRKKVDVVTSSLPDAAAVPHWYDDADLMRGGVYDVVLALANERGVRSRLAARHAAVLLHATTGRDWVSQLHRHVRGLDDCLECRMVDVVPPAVRCSEVDLGRKELGEEGGDAALPCLSAASGLMLATALQRLCSGELARGRTNDWRWYFRTTNKTVATSHRSCRDRCENVPSAPLRRRLYDGRRWSELDPAVAS